MCESNRKNSFAVSSQELGTALNNAASALASLGNTYEETLGIFAAGNATVQDIDKVSTGIRTIAARISASTAELETLGEDTTDVLSTADLAAKMEAYGVAILDANGELLSTYDILDQLADKWNSYTSVEQAAITDMFAGTRQANIFKSIMQNWSDAEAAVEACDSATGELADSYETYLSSIQGHIDLLTASWESLAQKLLSSNLVSTLIDGLTKIVDLLDKVAASVGDGILIIVPAITAALIAVYAAIKKVISAIASASALTKQSAELIAVVAVISTLLGLLADIENTAGGVATLILGITVAIGGLTAAVYALVTAEKASVILTAISLVVAGISAIVSAVATLFPTSSKLKENAVEAAAESKAAWEDAVEALEELEDQIEENEDRISELEDLVTNGKITSAELEELEILKQQTAQYEAQLAAKQALADETEEQAQKDAVDAINAINNELIGDSFGTQVLKGFVSGITFGISDLFGYGASTVVEQQSRSDIVAAAQSAWEEAKSQLAEYTSKYEAGLIDSATYQAYYDELTALVQESKQTVYEYMNEIQEQAETLTWYSGVEADANSENWKAQINAAYLEYQEMLDKFNLLYYENAGEGIEKVINRVTTADEYGKAGNVLQQLGDGALLTAENLSSIWSAANNGDAEELNSILEALGITLADDIDIETLAADMDSLLDYLEQLGIITADNTASLQAFAEQLNESAAGISSISYLDMLGYRADEFDTLLSALEDIEEYGIVAADTIQDLLNDYSGLEEYFEYTDQGYISKYESTMDALMDYAETFVQGYVDTLNSCEEGTEDYETAQDNLNNAIATMATLLRSQAIDEYTEKLEAQSDALEDQLDNYKDLIDIRKELLETYEEEEDYKKELASKQKSVSDLQTQLAVARLDTSAAGQAKVRELESELAEAEEELDDYTLEHAIDVLTDQMDDEYDEYERFIEEQVQELEDTIEKIMNNLKITYDENTGSYTVTVPEYHTGGYVGGYSAGNNEEFAKLMEGEYVATPRMIENFTNTTLPQLAATASSGGGNNYYSPLISFQCDSITDSALPQLESMINTAINKLKDEMDSGASRAGYKTTSRYKI